MDAFDDFQFWCAEYRDNPRISDAETERLLLGMCREGNPYALEEADLPPRDAVRDDLVTELERGPQLCTPGDELTRDDDSDERDKSFAGQSTPTQSTEYSDDWPEVAHRTKNQRFWRCECCGFQRYSSGLVHVHHIDGKKDDNTSANLQVLCAVCHGRKHSTTPLWPLGTNADEKSELLAHHARIRRGRIPTGTFHAVK